MRATGIDCSRAPSCPSGRCFVDALEEAFSAPPRPVNQRRPVEKSKQLCPWIEKINHELEKMEEPDRFSEVRQGVAFKNGNIFAMRSFTEYLSLSSERNLTVFP